VAAEDRNDWFVLGGYFNWKILLNLCYFIYRVHVSLTTVPAKNKLSVQRWDLFFFLFAAGTGEWTGLARERGWMQKHLGANPVLEGMEGLGAVSRVPISSLRSVLWSKRSL